MTWLGFAAVRGMPFLGTSVTLCPGLARLGSHLLFFAIKDGLIIVSYAWVTPQSRRALPKGWTVLSLPIGVDGRAGST